MFESLKKKFKGTIGKISDNVASEEELDDSNSSAADIKSKDETVPSSDSSENKSSKAVSKNDLTESSKDVSETESSETEAESDSKKSGFMGFLRGNKSSEKEESEDSKPSKTSETEEISADETITESEEKPEEDDKSGILSFVTNKTISEKDIEDILFELEMSLLEGDVAMEVAETIITSVKTDLVGQKIRRRSDVAEFTREALKKAISEILDIPGKDLTSLLEEAKKSGEPLKIMFVGINGTGKTTTIAKISTYFINKGYTPVIAASDTFRAGAIEQLTHHADNLDVKIIKHKKGADPAAVAFDAVAHARAKGKELVLVDTAGRMQTNINLMDEMKKIKRVIKPDLIIYVGDALTGNDSVEQAKKFNDAVTVDGIILTKADADAKGGAALSIGYVIQKPILFLGVGQSYSDIIEFKPEWMVEQILGE
ncbi:signal recognition particle-docking protein FtsY [Methanobacterium lacus]|uniref:Signal recognition particle receptor FtsY n=1 Tax=Methanobacterium lacus (strain AL-21) TaxID=877455 RepID=F0T9X7_METLA|nr:signal recognition particle-docking protein FtsY [Methanobacterium lacus]ADZ08800.1 signal recognition particle-docking protein FtsY [Methanobacterium lacus]